MKRLVITLFLMIGLVLALPSNAWDYSKNEDHPDGATSVDNLEKDGEYLIVNGSDLHNLAADLIGQKIRFRGYVRRIDRFPARKVLLLSEDRCYFVIMPYGTMLGDVPDDLRKRIESNAVRSAGGLFNRYEGDKLTIYCTIDMLCKEGGLTGSALRYKSCIVKPVQKWAKGWVDAELKK